MSRSLSLFSLSALLAVAPTGLFAKPLDCIRPVVIVPSTFSSVPGQRITYTVTLSGAATSAGYLSVSSSTMSNFSTLPAEADYNAGDTSVVFVGTVASSASGDLQVTASNAYGSVSSSVSVIEN